MKLTNEQSLLLYAISHQYVLLNNEEGVDDDVKRALCGTFNANKIEYKISDLLRDVDELEGMRLIEKNFKEKRFDVTLAAKNNPEVVTYDEKSTNKQAREPKYDSFMRTFWVIFCSFLKLPLIELLREIDESESKTFADLNVVSDIATSVLCDLAIKSGLVEKDEKGIVALTDKGKTMVAGA
jgi:DNA-binding MarR family transcriptional regulator